MPEIVFQQFAMEAAFVFSSWINIIENTAFGQVTDISILKKMKNLVKLKIFFIIQVNKVIQSNKIYW